MKSGFRSRIGRFPKRSPNLIWQAIRCLGKFFQAGGQRLFHLFFSCISFVFSLFGLGKPNYKQSALLVIGILLFSLSPQLNLPGVSNIAYAEINIDDPFLYLEDNFIQKPFVSGLNNPSDAIISYEVQVGDTLSAVASRYGITLNTILWANDLANANTVRPGMKLKILPVSGLLHKVKKGDSLTKIAQNYKINQDIIIYQNKLEPEANLAAGTELILPGAEMKLAAPRRDTYIATDRGSSYRNNPGYDIKYGGGNLLMPTDGRLTQGFRNGHYGIDLANRALPPIYAAEAGKVLKAKYQGWNGGYGHHVIIEHDNGLQTLYAHMSDVYVQPGQLVARGEAIGRVGNTGKSTGPHLHFEVINQGRKSNPWNYLPTGASLTSSR